MVDKNKKISWFMPSFEGSKKIVNQVLDSNFLNEGKITKEFEDKVSHFLGTKYCITTTSGTASLSLSLFALGITYGDEVLVPNLTFIATANAVKLAGASVKLVDVNKINYTVCCDDILRKISKKTKCIISVDVNGRGADYQKLNKICKEHNLFLICDSAEAFGSYYKNNKIGNYGDLSCFSFSPLKTISTGQGGIIVTKKKSTYEKLLSLKDQGRPKRGTGGDDLHPSIGFNFKFTNVQAAIGISQLKKINNRIKKFKKRDYLYRKLLLKSDKIYLPPKQNENEILQWFDILSDDIKIIKRALIRNKIDFRPFWLPINTQKPYLEKGNFSNSHYISKRGIWLPSSFDISEEQISFVCDTILKSLKKS